MTDSSATNSTVNAAAGAAAQTELRIPLHDPVPTLFADGCHAADIIANCVRLDLFAEHAWQGSKSTQPMVVGRIVMPLERIETFVRGLNALVKKLQDDKAQRTAEMANKK